MQRKITEKNKYILHSPTYPTIYGKLRYVRNSGYHSPILLQKRVTHKKEVVVALDATTTQSIDQYVMQKL